jgi:L-aminopeptidase/D-esterase-like protein
MTPELWVGIVGTLFLLGFIINGWRLSKGPEGHAANAGRLHMVMGGITLPFMWLAVVAAVNM